MRGTDKSFGSGLYLGLEGCPESRIGADIPAMPVRDRKSSWLSSVGVLRVLPWYLPTVLVHQELFPGVAPAKLVAVICPAVGL